MSTASQPNSVRILFLTANPSDTSQLRLGAEVRTIDDVLARARYREHFELIQHHAVRVSDIQELLQRHQPHIVHFSGHGSDDGQIIFEDSEGRLKPVSARALGTTFSLLRGEIRCVVLNACFSQIQAEAIAQHIPCVIGMSTAISDGAASSFSASFYRALAFGQSLSTAFQLGRAEIDLEGMDEMNTPQIIHPTADPNQIFIVQPENGQPMPSSAELEPPLLSPPVSPQALDRPQVARTEAALYDAFLSYAPDDEEWVSSHLIPRLDAAGIKWIDPAGFTPGVALEVELERVVTQSTRTLLILSASYLENQWRRDDSLLAGHFGLSLNAWPIIPVLIADCTLPLRLSMLTPVDLRRDSPRNWDRLIASLNARPTG